ncbi:MULTISPECIES: helix-turn-helix domain-containing protein [Prauserella salsuginis group]|uniref:DNA-binding phage protein n=2 Tax=Prauserella salsuginis group TaxID=2893672 RepID=A0A839XS73_9PSEU|nr:MULTISPECIES: helix-turn-helix transcriptional regulator [Prauserella salsuginis group]MBB3662826.1 DNA-binding phage protein [Prauserella sediminis]
MVRVPLSEAERLRGERLGVALRGARGARSMVAVAADAGISVETLRKIETGRIPTPAFFTVMAIADAVGLPLDDLRTTLADPTGEAADTALSPRADAG